MSLFEERIAYKPFSYPWCYEAWLTQQKVHWLPEEVPMADDIKDWNFKLSPTEKNLITQILRLFVQSDVEVSKSYHMIYLSRFKPIEIQMMLQSFQNMETIHVSAYSHLIDTLGLPENEYAAFLSYSEMKEKYEAWAAYMNPESLEDLAVSMAAFGGTVEGLQLFASFAMLLNFPRFNKLKGLGQIITWSVRDETLHCLSIIKLFHELLREHPEIDTPQLRARVEGAVLEAVTHEDAFIDLAFGMGGIEGMTAEDIKTYIRFIADRRLIQLGYKGIFKVKENPLAWLDEMLNAEEHVNFFEQRATSYSKAATKGTWEEAFADLDAQIQSKPAEPEWIVYSKSGCPGCVVAKRQLVSRGIDYQEVVVDEEAERAKLYAKTNMRTMPVIMHKGQVVGSSNDLRSYLVKTYS
jgi:ribonucleoside-diphosphate reductase beta chain